MVQSIFKIKAKQSKGIQDSVNGQTCFRFTSKGQQFSRDSIDTIENMKVRNQPEKRPVVFCAIFMALHHWCFVARSITSYPGYSTWRKRATFCEGNLKYENKNKILRVRMSSGFKCFKVLIFVVIYLILKRGSGETWS